MIGKWIFYLSLTHIIDFRPRFLGAHQPREGRQHRDADQLEIQNETVGKQVALNLKGDL